MGCLTSPKTVDPQEQIRLLSNFRNKVVKAIETNELKISKAKKDIQEIDENIKQIVNDLVQNQNSYSEGEKLQKAQKILELKAERQRVQYGFDLFYKNNKNFKNYLSMIEKRIEELKNSLILNKQNDIMNKKENTEVTPFLIKHLEDLLKQEQNVEEILTHFHPGNNEFGTADDLLKQIFGNGIDGAPTA